jgi:HPt (histidine-containing phosphotransfer) domain-containing protein
MSDSRPESPADPVQAQLAKLKKKYGTGLPDKITAIEAAIAPVFAGGWNEPVCETAHRMVHSLAGSSGTYGFSEITPVARAAEVILKAALAARTAPPPDQKARLDGLVATLRELAAAAARQMAG